MSASSSTSEPGRLSEADRLPPRRPAVRYWSQSARRALLAAVSSKSPRPSAPSLASLVGECDQDELVELALSERVAGVANERLGELLTPSARARLLAEVQQETFRHLAYLGLLQGFATAFEEADVIWAVLKGPVLTELSYKRTSRGYADLDLMVHARQLRAAVEALVAAGAAVPAQNWALLIREAKGELNMAVHGLASVDLHWHLVYHRGARERFMISTDELLERRRRVQLGPVHAWTLEPADFAAHVALHASFAGAQRLHRLVDIERTLANQPPDWDDLVRRCRAWHAALPVSAMLNSARETLGAAVPDDVISELAGGPFGRLLTRQLSRWIPFGHLPGGRSVKTGLSRSLRDNPRATTAAFASETWRTVGELLRPPPEDPGDPRHAFYDSGGPAGLERFIEMVNTADYYGHLSKTVVRRFAAGR
jgi:hypothetical protein